MPNVVPGKIKPTADNPYGYVGICLEHKSLKNAIYTVEIPDVIYPVPYECNGWCKKKHIFKTIHMVLDNNGRTTVHPGIYELLKNKGKLGPLSALREVVPSHSVISMERRDRPRFVVSLEHGNIRLYDQDNPNRYNGLSDRILEGETSGELSV